MNALNKVAIIGVGNWGKKVLKEADLLFEVVAYSDKNKDVQNYMLTQYPNIKKLNFKLILNSKNIETVIITTPIETHYQITKECLQNNKNVFVEKPLSITYKQSLELEKIALQKNLTLFTGYVFIYSQIYKSIKNLINKNEILHIDFNWKKLGTFGNNIAWNLLVHEISILIDLVGKIKILHLIHPIENNYTQNKIELDGFTKNNVSFSITINRDSVENKNKIITIFTKRNKIIWNNDTLTVLNNKNTIQKYEKETISSLVIELKSFIQNLNDKNNRKNINTSKEVTKTVEKIVKYSEQY